MGKRSRWQDHPDPEYRRWGETYTGFPGVEECMRLIIDGKARGSWADLIVQELAENARDCFAELVEAFHRHENERVRLFVLMALEEAKLPESVPFLTELLQSDEDRFRLYAERTLQAIDTRESRTSLWMRKQE